MCMFKAVLLGMKSTLVSDVQAVINFKMIAIQNTDLPSGSNSLVKYYVAKLDRSKSQGEYCVENEECQSSVCSLKMCKFSVDSAILDSNLYTKLLDLIGEALSRLYYFFNIHFTSFIYSSKGFSQSTQLSLLWRGSQDGFSSSKFHNLCDNKGKTLTVVKTTRGFIIGGYTKEPWSQIGTYVADPTAFMFSLVNPSNTPLKLPVILTYSYSTYATFHAASYGPSFGTQDLWINDNSNTVKLNYANIVYYTPPNGLKNTEAGIWIVGESPFLVADIEVFLVG